MHSHLAGTLTMNLSLFGFAFNFLYFLNSTTNARDPFAYGTYNCPWKFEVKFSAQEFPEKKINKIIDFISHCLKIC